MKCQYLFSGKSKKNISKCLLKILPRMLSINVGTRIPTFSHQWNQPCTETQCEITLKDIFLLGILFQIKQKCSD